MRFLIFLNSACSFVLQWLGALRVFIYSVQEQARRTEFFLFFCFGRKHVLLMAIMEFYPIFSFAVRCGSAVRRDVDGF